MRIDPIGNEELKLVLEPEEAVFLQALPARLRRVLEDAEFNRRITERLFPVAHDDPEKDAEHRRLLGDDLKRRKLEGVEIFERSLSSAREEGGDVVVRIGPEEFEFWLGFVNDFRLMLGVELDITEDGWGADFDPLHPRAAELALLHFLTWLEQRLLESSGIPLPDVDPGDVK